MTQEKWVRVRAVGASSFPWRREPIPGPWIPTFVGMTVWAPPMPTTDSLCAQTIPIPAGAGVSKVSRKCLMNASQVSLEISTLSYEITINDNE